jgi:acetolactate synthase-1/2/3 large subunit
MQPEGTAAMSDNRRRGGQILVDQLKAFGCDLCFGVPGESYLAVLDAFHDAPELRFVICRQEGGAAMMAEAYGKLTGRPGVAFVTRGPGATNASAGVHIAQQDSTPMILFVGQVDRSTRHRDTFQELDYGQMFGTMAKWAAEIDNPARIPEYVHRAFRVATSGRPGPVVLALPEDMLLERAAAEDAISPRPIRAAPDPVAIETLGERLARAERPFMILGGSGWSAPATRIMAKFALSHDIPVACGFRRQDLIHNEHPCYVGDIAIGPNPALVEAIRRSDLLIAVGTRLSEMTTQGFALLGVPVPGVPLAHVHPDPAELGKVYQAELPIGASIWGFVSAVERLIPAEPRPRSARTAALRASYEAWRRPKALPGDVQLGEIVVHLRETLPEDAIVTNGAGNYCVWVNRFYSYRGYRTQLAPTAGSMGYGFPAAVAAKLVHPDRPVVCFAGDGCFLMTGQELATAVQYGAAVVTIVVDNGMYGTIRMHQEREFPTRVSGTDLRNPDFAALARAYGAFGATVTRTADFAPAFAEALACGGPAVLHLKVDPEALTPRASLSEIRAEALAAGR